ncbi:MAG: membrane protein insertase YidC [Bacteroidales bacterium]|nr:membrane protein insertase YidC [Bacteroidales bacterium]
MDKKTVTGLILIFAILMFYSYLNKPSKEEIAERQRIQDSIAKVQQKSIDTTKIADIQEHINTPEKTDLDQVEEPENNSDELGVFSNSAQGKEKIYLIETDLLKIKISNKGGKIISAILKDYKTHDSLPLELIEKNSSDFGFEFFANNRYINTNNLFFQSGDNNTDSIITVSKADSCSLSLRLYTNNNDLSHNSYIEYIYTFKGDNYMFDLSVNFVGLKNVISSNTDYLNLNWNTNLLQQEKSVSKYNGATIYYKYYNDDVKYLSETKDDDKSLKTKIKWISYKQQFFTSTLIADKYFINADIKTFTNKKHKKRYLRTMSSTIGVQFNPMADKNNIKLHFYYGPNKYRTLRKYHLDLEHQIPLGWSFFLMHWINRFAVIPVFNFLEGFNFNYGIIILILTILLKIVLFPIAYKTYSSSAKMRVLKPEIDEISKKYPKKEDAMKKQQATMALYKKVGVSPMAGCLPMLLQFPILIALFRFFPAAIELRQQSFLWATDLSSYDSIWNFPNGFSIPFYGDHVSLFTLLMTISTIIYTKINNDTMGTSSTQMPGMKAMTYLMPIMFLGIFNNYSAGLSYYYFLANIFTFAQMYFIKQHIDEDKLRKKLLANQKKTVKKSKFQKRLEDMAKQKGYNQYKKK